MVRGRTFFAKSKRMYKHNPIGILYDIRAIDGLFMDTVKVYTSHRSL